MSALLPGIGQSAVDIESSNVSSSKKALNSEGEDKASFKNTMGEQQRKVDKAPSKLDSSEQAPKEKRVASEQPDKPTEETSEANSTSTDTSSEGESTTAVVDEEATAEPNQAITEVSDQSDKAVDVSFSFVAKGIEVDPLTQGGPLAQESPTKPEPLLNEQAQQHQSTLSATTSETVVIDSVGDVLGETEQVSIQGQAAVQSAVNVGETVRSDHLKTVKPLSSGSSQILPDAKGLKPASNLGPLTQNVEDLRGRVLGAAIEQVSDEGADSDGAKTKFVLQPTAVIKPATSGVSGLLSQVQAQTSVTVPAEALVRTDAEAVVTEKAPVSGFTTQTFTSLTGLTTPQAAAVEARMQMPVSIAFGEAGWAAMVAERSAMMASQRIKFAELQLDPPELGPMQVKVTVNNDQQASVSFIAPNAQVKDALDQTIVRLREMLEQQGLDLVDVNVSDQAPEESDQGEADEDAEQSQDNESVDAESASRVEAVTRYGVDQYA